MAKENIRANDGILHVLLAVLYPAVGGTPPHFSPTLHGAVVGGCFPESTLTVLSDTLQALEDPLKGAPSSVDVGDEVQDMREQERSCIRSYWSWIEE